MTTYSPFDPPLRLNMERGRITLAADALGIPLDV